MTCMLYESFSTVRPGDVKYKVLTLQEDYVSNDNVVVGGTGTVEVDEAKNTFLLKDIQVAYTAENGYETALDLYIEIIEKEEAYNKFIQEITRAKDMLVIIGSSREINLMILNDNEEMRYSSLSCKLKTKLKGRLVNE